MGCTANRQVGNAHWRRRSAAVLGVVLLLVACSAAVPTSPLAETPTASPAATPTRIVAGSLLTPPVLAHGPVIEQVVLASALDDRGEPADPRTVFPEDAKRLILCVLADGLVAGTQFRAVWYAGDALLGQSDYVVREGDGPERWIALTYLPRFPLDPAEEHVVELLVDLEPVERFVFRVGVGSPADIVAEAALGHDVDAQGAIVWESDRFHVDTPRIVLLTRISTQVDTRNMVFDAVWYRGDTLIGHTPPRDGQPRFEGTPTRDDLRMIFVLKPQAPLLVGRYRVALLLNGHEIASYPFTVTTELPPTPTPSPTPSPTPTPTPTITPSPSPTPTASPTASVSPTPTRSPSLADVNDLVVTTEVDPTTNEPIGPRVFVWEDDPESLITLWVAIHVSDLRLSDNLTLVVYQDGREYGTRRLPDASIDDGWIATLIGLDVPSLEKGDYIYTVSVFVNGQRSLETSFQLSAIQGP